MVVLSELIQGYCEALSINESMIFGTKRTRDVIEHRSRVAALIIKTIDPELIVSKDPYPVGLLKKLMDILGTSKPSICKLANNARFYYRTYSDFRKEVDQ